MSGNAAKRPCLSSGPEDVTCAGEKGIEGEKCTYLWTVNKFSMISDSLMTSPVFRGGSRNNHTWRLFMDPKNEIEGVDYLSLYLELVDFGHGDDSPNRTVNTHYKLSVLNVSIAPQMKQFHEFEKCGLVGRRKVISLADLHSPDMRIVVDDSLKVLCEIWIDDGLVKSVQTGPPVKSISLEEERNKMFKKRFATEFGKLFGESIGFDITILTKSGRTFKAHKAVLMARSPILAEKIISKPKDGKNWAIPDCEEFNDEIIKGMLEHLYTGRTDCLPMRAEELLKISDKLKIADLKENCEFVFTEQLTNENAAATLILADKFNAPFLKRKAIAFIKANMDELLNLKSFQDIMKAQATRNVLVDIFLS